MLSRWVCSGRFPPGVLHRLRGMLSKRLRADKTDRKTEPMISKFKIEGDYIELVKLLKVTGLCGSGGMAKTAAGEGQVKVDGVVELRKRCKIRRGQRIEFEGNIVEVE